MRRPPLENDGVDPISVSPIRPTTNNDDNTSLLSVDSDLSIGSGSILLTDDHHDSIVDATGDSGESENQDEYSIPEPNITCTRPKGKIIKILYTNADSLLGKRDLLKLRIEQTQPDIIAVTEILPKNMPESGIQDCEWQIEGYSCFLNRNPKRGISIYAAQGLSISLNEELSVHKHEEQIWCNIKFDSRRTLLLGCIYHSPDSSQQNFDELTDMVKKASSMKHDAIIIVGDFNMRSIDWQNWFGKSKNDEEFIELVQDMFLSQLVDKPTRFRHGQKPSLLDLILTNKEELISNLEYHSPLGKSDHVTLCFEVAISADLNLPTTKRLMVNKANFEAIAQVFARTDWDTILQDTNATAAWEIFVQIYKQAIQEHVPMKEIRPRRNKHPLWMNKGLLNAVKRKHWAFQRYQLTGQQAEYDRYKSVRNSTQATSRRLRQELEKSIAESAKHNPKLFWSYVNNKTKTRQGIEVLVDESGNAIEDDLGKANLLNEFLASVFTVEDMTNIPTATVHEIQHHLETPDLTEEVMIKLLKNLKPDKSQGPDQVHPRILREAAEQVAKPLCIIFKKSLDEGILPEDWKRANVTPIFKKGSHKDPSNYRPVSLTSICGKLLEKVIRDQVMDHLQINSLLSGSQYGFRSHRSTVLQLLKVLDDWSDMIDQGCPVDTVYLDFRKAFDTVPHERLLIKMKAYGIAGKILDWVQNFLSHRVQRVVLNGAYSGWRDVTSGIPQGSVLGPLLFIIYINDLPERVNSPTALFADDTKAYRRIASPQDHLTLQDDLNKLWEWSNTWQLGFNVAKCKVLHYGPGNPQQSYSMGDAEDAPIILEDCEEKDLGVTFDNALKFRRHISNICNKANRMVGLVRRSFKFLNGNTFLRLYKALIRPHLEYACSVWNPLLIEDRDKLERVQRRATKLVPSIADRSYSDRLQALDLPSLVHRRMRGDIIQTFKIVKGIEDVPVEDYFAFNTTSRTRGHTLKLAKPRARTSKRSKSFTHRVIDTWNGLPQEVVDAETLNSFKNRLDRFWADHPNKFDFKA